MRTITSERFGAYRPATREDVRTFFEVALDDLVEPGRLLVLAVPAPTASPETLLRALPLQDGFIYRPPSGETCAGIGATVRLDAQGAERTGHIRAESRAAFERVDLGAWPQLAAPAPRMHGGLAFGVGTNDEAPWEAFGDGCFTLPRWYFLRDGSRGTLMHALDPSEPDWRDRTLAELERVWQALEADAAVDPAPPDRSRSIESDAVAQLDYPTWRSHIEHIRSVIRDGAFEKIVAARQSRIASPTPFDDLHVFQRLGEEYPHCNLFLFRREGATFLGASPENLFVKRDAELVTHALAGSMFIGPLDDPTDMAVIGDLMNSSKDAWEHEVVVRQIVGSLTPLAERVEHEGKPGVVKVRNLLHLNTPIRATLKADTHPLDVVDALHPTPAVGGVPRWEAVRWIQENEGIGRGWYTGPLGWFDADGDAEFVVAIRCGLLMGDEALLFAGAGIVEASDPYAEYEETALKQQPILRALGVDV